MSSTQFFLLLIFYKDGTLVTFNKLILTRQKKKKVFLKVMHSAMDFSLRFPELCDDVISWGVRQEGPRQLSSGWTALF